MPAFLPMKKLFILLLFLPLLAAAQSERIYLLEEGNWQSDNGQMSYIEDHVITRNWFSKKTGHKIGDTPQYIVYLPKRNILAISVNWSNIIYYLTPEGKELAATEDIPNCRALCFDPEENFLYITSYAHKAYTREYSGGPITEHTYTKGYVARVVLSPLDEGKDPYIDKTCEVGYEPEGIAFNAQNKLLYIANTGGYAFQESHGYEYGLSVVHAYQMMKVRNDVPIINEKGDSVINLYGEMTHTGPYICINSPGNYGNFGAESYIPPSCVIFNMDSLTYKVYDHPATYNTVIHTPEGDKFLIVGSDFNYQRGTYEYNVATINPRTKEYRDGVCQLPDGTYSTTLATIAANMYNPYCVYQNPYTYHTYIVDADSYAAPGDVYEIDEKGQQVGKALRCYINAGHMVAIPPVGYEEGLARIPLVLPSQNGKTYDLNGREVSPQTKGIVIRNGRKILNR